MPKTKAECDSEINQLKKKIENEKEVLARAKANHGSGRDTRSVQISAKDEIERCKQRIKQLQDYKKSLK